MELIITVCASILAGFVDSIVGGGGLILLPALFATFISANAVILIATSKAAAICGTSLSAFQYARRISFKFKIIVPAVICAMLGSILGAYLVTLVATDWLRRILPFILFLVLIYTLMRKDFGLQHNKLAHKYEVWIISAIGFFVGVYDGFFGPGTGSFFIFLLVRFLAYDFLHASAYAKLLNLATNFSALSLFTLKGLVWWQIVMPLAIANVFGAFVGTYFALRYGAGFVRWIFISVVSALILKTAFDAFGL